MSDALTPEQREWERTSEVHGPAFEPTADPAPRLIIFGAVPAGGRAARAAARVDRLDCRSWWIRASGSPRLSLFPDAERVIAAWPQEAFAAARAA